MIPAYLSISSSGEEGGGYDPETPAQLPSAPSPWKTATIDPEDFLLVDSEDPRLSVTNALLSPVDGLSSCRVKGFDTGTEALGKLLHYAHMCSSESLSRTKDLPGVIT